MVYLRIIVDSKEVMFHFVFGAIWLAASHVIRTECASSYGDEFVLCFMHNWNHNNSVPPEVMLTTPAQKPVQVTLSVPRGSASLFAGKTLTVSRDEPVTISLPTDLRLKDGIVVVEDKVLLVKASAPVGVVGTNKGPHTGDSFLVLPVAALGNSYFSLNVADEYTHSPSEVAVVAADKKAKVKIRLPPSLDARLVNGQSIYTGGDVFSITLEPYQAFQLQADGDLSGTRLEADSPIGVFSGSDQAAIEGASQDHVVEMLPPVDKWGSYFIVLPVQMDQEGNILKFVAKSPGTTIDIEVPSKDLVHKVVTVHAGQSSHYRMGRWDELVIVTSTSPILLALISRSYMGHEAMGDPSLMLISPVSHYVDFYTYKAPYPDKQVAHHYNSYLALACPSDDVTRIFIKGPGLSSVFIPEWRKVGSSGYSAAIYKFSHNSVYTVQAAGENVRFGAWIYGYVPYESYAHPGAMEFRDERTGNYNTIAPPGDAAVNMALRDGQLQTIPDVSNPDALSTVPQSTVKALGMSAAILIVAIVVVFKIAGCYYTLRETIL